MLGYFALTVYTVFSYPIRFIFFLASFIHSRPRQFRKVRIQSRKKFAKLPFSEIQNKNVYWFHGASVGELDQAKALGRVLKTKEDNSFLIMSWISDSVSEKNLIDSPADFHVPLPLDGPFSYDFYFKRIPLKKLVIFSWDTWAWMILSAKKQGAETYLACATLGEKSKRKGWFSKNLTKFCFSQLDGILPAHNLHEPRIRALLETDGKKSKQPFIETFGDTRFDSVIQKMLGTQASPVFQRFIRAREEFYKSPKNKSNNSSSKNSKKEIFLFASTYAISEECILLWAKENATLKEKNLQIWIFPHKIEEKRIQSLLLSFQKIGIHSSRFSEIQTESNELYDTQAIIFDEMGILAFAYQYADIAYVGGALHHRVHNVIEPGYWALPLITGPKIYNSSEAIVMNQLGGLKIISSTLEFSKIIEESIQMNSSEKLRIGKINKNFVMENQGASEKIYQRIWVG